MERPGGSSSGGSELPPTVQAMLRISGDSADRRSQTAQAMAPSPLLERMQNFLPLMAAANAALPDERAPGGTTCVEILEQSGGASPNSRPISGIDHEATAPIEQTAASSTSLPACGTASHHMESVSHVALEKMTSGEGDVLMDLYVDISCGELVGREEEARPIRPRIVEISNDEASKPLD
jgi:hypothetical protein